MKEGSIENQEKISLYTKAEELKSEHPDTKDFIYAVQRFIRNLPELYNPKSIIESRFTPADEAFEKGMMSCGAIANMSAAMLRHVGLQVKLIHGEFDKSVDHAWISVLEPENGEWVDYDLQEMIRGKCLRILKKPELTIGLRLKSKYQLTTQR